MFLTSFASAFLTTTFLLQWWIRPSYPTALWLLLGFFGLIGCLPFGKLRAFGGCFWFQRSLAARAAARPALLLSCTLGIALALWNVARIEQSIITSLQHLPFETPLQIEGMVTGLPESHGNTITYTVALRTIVTEQERLPIKGKITARTRSIGSPFTHGDIVQIAGSVEHIPPPYEQYFRAQGILGSMPQTVITGTGRREGSSILRILARWNAHVVERIRDLFPEPEASLLAGLLLGNTGGFSKETLSTFRTAGLSHILAVSGYNITLLLIALSVLVTRLPPLLRFTITLAGVTLFTLLVGGSPSAIRAVLMGSLGLLALHTRHLPDTRRAMLLAAFLMLLWNPMQLWWDASFQLSFLAVIGITELQQFFKNFLQRIPDSFGMRETLTVTLAAECTALPWAAALFGNIPLFGPLTNILVAPAIPFIMLTGPIALLGGTLHDLLGRILAFPCWVALQWIVRIAETTTLLPFASIPFPEQAFLLILFYYVGLLIVFLWSRDPLASLRLPTTDTGTTSRPHAKGELSAPQ